MDLENIMLNERKSQKTTCCMALYEMVRQIHGDEKQINSCPGRGELGMGSDADGHGACFRGDENVLIFFETKVAQPCVYTKIH